MALRFRWTLILILFLTGAVSYSAQTLIQPSVQGQSGVSTRLRSIEGTVLDKAGTPVPGAVVLLKDMKTLQVRSFIAQKNGTYRFYGLSSDINYQVRAQSQNLTSPTKNISVFDSHPKIIVERR